jgi:hypothetical protein
MKMPGSREHCQPEGPSTATRQLPLGTFQNIRLAAVTRIKKNYFEPDE